MSPTTDQMDGFVTVTVAGQTFGVPVMQVQDVITATRIDRAPLAPPEVAGLLNLRGRIVTAVDLRRRLRAPERPEGQGHMCVIVEQAGELYALQVDDVGDVLWLPRSEREPAPITLSADWRALVDGLHRLQGDLLLALNIQQTLTLNQPQTLAA